MAWATAAGVKVTAIMDLAEAPDLMVSPAWDLTAPRKRPLQKTTNIPTNQLPILPSTPFSPVPRVTHPGDPCLWIFTPLFPQDFQALQCLQFQPPPDLPAPEKRGVYE